MKFKLVQHKNVATSSLTLKAVLQLNAIKNSKLLYHSS